MRSGFRNSEHSIIINYSVEFNDTCEGILASEGIKVFLADFLKNLAVKDITIFSWLTNGRELEELVWELITLAKQLMVLEPEEINSSYFQGVNRLRAEYILQESYRYWLNHQRFAIVYETSNNVLAFSSATEADSLFNQAISEMYKRLQKKLLGIDMNVVHLLQSGTNSVVLLNSYKWKVPSDYSVLKGLPFIRTAMIKTPLMYKYPATYKGLDIVESNYNPSRQCHINRTDWICVPVKCGKLLCYCYFHVDFIGAVIALLNLFELATEQECLSQSPDMIIIYGAQDEEDDTTVFNDTDNGFWVGKISYSSSLNDVRYLEKIILNIAERIITNDNSMMVEGCLIDIYCKGNYARSVLILGETDYRIFTAAKMLTNYSIQGRAIDKAEVVFYHHGQVSVSAESNVTSFGLMTGRIVEMKHLSNVSQYDELARSVFYNPDDEKALAIVPVSMYRYIISPRQINLAILLNDYDNMEVINRLAEVKMPTGIIDTYLGNEYCDAFCKQLISIMNE